MLKFQELIRNLEIDQAIAERQAKELAEMVFQHWRMFYEAELYRAIRHVYQMQARGKTSGISARWCNAAGLILDVAGDAIADRFLRSPESQKDSLVAAVLADGGIYDEHGRWVELPLL